jgi:hypothetical protein
VTPKQRTGAGDRITWQDALTVPRQLDQPEAEQVAARLQRFDAGGSESRFP